MTNKSTKKALVMSLLSLVVCISMLVGTTFAWFTDTVTSTGNIIKSGNLDIAMYWAEGDEDPAAVTDWKDASKGAIFNSQLWEPGYTEAKHIKIANEGSLALIYQMRILANGVVSELADVIDVYYFAEAEQLSRASLTDANKLGTLSDVLNNTNANAITNKIQGSLEANTSTVVTLALKMQESAGNEYQNLSIGTDFSVQLIATQHMSEFDSFGKDYDKNANYPIQDPPSAMVSKLTGDELNITEFFTGNAITLDAGYQFEPTEPGDLVEEDSKYRWWHADFVVSADSDVAANSLMLAGYYSLYCDAITDGNWVGLSSSDDIKAGTEVRLLQSMSSDLYVAYKEICNYGNDGIGFRCGVKDLDGSNEGTTVTVKLRLYEVENADSDTGSHNVETGNYIDLGTFTYLFGGEYVTEENGAVYFYADDGDVVLYSAKNVTDTDFVIPAGVTEIGSFAFGGNTATKSVVFPSTVTSIGYQAFKGSAVESVTLNEGLTTIGGYAFNGATNLTSFNIPSTVTTIGERAFRSTAATELTVPAAVTSIGDGAFRDMANLTTVTIEGNAVIANFAFRTCKALETVYIKGDDVTFTGTSMAFTHEDSGRSGGIVIYVENTTVASRLIVAQGSASGYTSDKYVIMIGEEELAVVKNTDALNTAITSGSKYVYLADGTYDMSKSANAVTFIGASEAGVKINYTIQHSGLSVGSIWRESHFENLTFTNTVFTVMEGGKSTFNNVTFAAGFRRGYGSGVVFTDCTFGSNSEGYALHFETDGSTANGTIQLNNCEFQGGKVHLGNGRTYAFTGCEFAAGTDFQVWGNITLDGCTSGGTAVTADNISTLFPDLNTAKVTIK